MVDHAADVPRLPARSVMNRVSSFEWDPKQAVRYEVALEMLGQEIAACSWRIALEEKKAEPDQAILDACNVGIDRLAVQRRELRSTDVAGIDQVLVGARDRIAAWKAR